ncbi:prolyl endopeptidase FAP-like protein, partial [Leptotrombidium deliense]
YIFGEEIEGSIWWSNDGASLVYATYNDTAIPTHPIKFYGSVEDTLTKTMAPKIVTQRYPKAGIKEQNPVVKLWYISLNDSNNELREVLAPHEIATQENYLTFVHWISPTELIVVWTLRTQNFSVITSCGQENKWACKVILKLEGNIATLKNLMNAILVVEDKRLYFLRSPRPDVEHGSYFHISMNKLDEQNKFPNFITHGKYDVTKLLAFDSDSNVLYYQRTATNHREQRHIYKLQLNESNDDQCITCALNDGCSYYDATFSLSAKYYVLQCLGPKVPYSEFWQSEGNKSKCNYFLLCYVTGHLNHVFHTSEGEQSINDRFAIEWGTYLSSRKEFIYAKIDIDQRDKRNNDNKFSDHRHNFEIQIDVINQLVKEMSEIDKTKIAIWGSGLAAFNALSSLASDTKNVLQCAIAVAPVTNWRYLDTVTAEYLLGLPLTNDNFAPYQKINLLSKADKLASKKFLVVHGTADGNKMFHVSCCALLHLSN